MEEAIAVDDPKASARDPAFAPNGAKHTPILESLRHSARQVSTDVDVRVDSTMLMMAAGARRAPVMRINHPSTHADDELHALHTAGAYVPTTGHNVLWGVCTEGPRALNDLCCSHERCSNRLCPQACCS
jgi:hypothetical protein